ncbi:MAG: hypothetical protein AB7O98_12790 [Hyphomonadaceae bacterium]
MRNNDGRRDLSLIRASGSTSRVLNLALVHERFGETPEYEAKPLFKNKRLNRALILKHVVRPHERDLFTRPTAAATKVILPYSATELTLGGVSFLVGEIRFEKLMRELVGHYESEAQFQADADLLRAMAQLPSFDPFLMRERLRHLGVDPARCYFEIAEADIARMRAFVGREIAQLVNLAFGGGAGAGASELSNRLAEKLMTDETAKSLDPLRATLRLSGEEYVEGVFAWKGFLYYKWLMDELRPQLKEFQPRFAGLRVVGATSEERRELAQSRKDILDKATLALRRVDETLKEYAEAFASLADGQANAFRSFLLKAPSLFIPIGEAVGVIRHIHSFWRYRFPDSAMPSMNVDEAIEILHDFETTIAGVDFIQPRGDELRVA